MGRRPLDYLPKTEKRWYCLMLLSEGPKTTWDVSIAAEQCGRNTGTCWSEWADAAFKELRGWGFIRYANQRKDRRQVHEITPQGRLKLEEWSLTSD